LKQSKVKIRIEHTVLSKVDKVSAAKLVKQNNFCLSYMISLMW